MACRPPIPERYRKVLTMQLEELDLIDRHVADLSRELGEALRSQQEEVVRLCEMRAGRCGLAGDGRDRTGGGGV